MDGIVNWFLGGACRSCKSVYVDCQCCGYKGILTEEVDFTCNCPYTWKTNGGSIEVYNMIDDDEPSDPNQLDIKFEE